MHIRHYRNVLAAIFVAIFAFHADIARADSASSLVKGFQAALLEVMKSAKSTDVKTRFNQLAPTVEATFHVPLMTQIATGRFWGQATMEEKTAVVAAFRRMSVATLATLFDGYSNAVFDVTGARPGPSKTTVVMTKLTKSDKSHVDIAYVARQFGTQWRLIDIVIDNGISELKVRRSEYNQVLKKSGLAGLIKLLNGKADDLMSRE